MSDYPEGYVEEVLAALKIEPENFRGSEILALCPGHLARTGRVDRDPSWYINSDSGDHICFSCGFKGTLPYLVSYRLDLRTKWGNIDIPAGERWLRERTEVDLDLVLAKIERSRQTQIARQRLVPMTEGRLGLFTDAPDWALKARNLTRGQADAYGIRWQEDKDCWITPIRDPDDGKLWGWQAKSQTERWMRNRPLNVKKAETIFGWNTYQGGTAVVVEAPLDAARVKKGPSEVEEVEAVHGLATFGSQLSNKQLLMMRGVDRLIVAMDNPYVDKAGLKAATQILKACRELRFEAWFFNYSGMSEKGLGDMTDEQVEQGIATARHSVMGKKAILG